MNTCAFILEGSLSVPLSVAFKPAGAARQLLNTCCVARRPTSLLFLIFSSRFYCRAAAPRCATVWTAALELKVLWSPPRTRHASAAASCYKVVQNDFSCENHPSPCMGAFQSQPFMGMIRSDDAVKKKKPSWNSWWVLRRVHVRLMYDKVSKKQKF